MVPTHSPNLQKVLLITLILFKSLVNIDLILWEWEEVVTTYGPAMIRVVIVGVSDLGGVLP